MTTEATPEVLAEDARLRREYRFTCTFSADEYITRNCIYCDRHEDDIDFDDPCPKLVEGLAGKTGDTPLCGTGYIPRFGFFPLHPHADFIGSVLTRDGDGVDVFRHDNTDDFSLILTGPKGGPKAHINLGKLQGRALARLLEMEDYE